MTRDAASLSREATAVNLGPTGASATEVQALRTTLDRAIRVIKACILERASKDGFLSLGSALEVLNPKDIRGLVMDFKASERVQKREEFTRALRRNTGACIFTLTREELQTLTQVEIAALLRASKFGRKETETLR